MPLITIIIPTYNSENTIRCAIQSIISQSFTDFEIIIIDGLSEDKTIETVHAFCDPRITVHSERDKGIYDAMNKGIKFATGEWLYFLGSDDTLYSDNLLTQLVSYMKDCDSIYGNVYRMKKRCVYDGEFTADKLYKKNICHQAIFLKKTVFDKVGFFDQFYKVKADYEHNFRWFLNPSIKTIYVDLIIARYADDGFSNTTEDYAFLQNKNFLYLKYGKKTLSRSQKLKIYRAEFMRFKRELQRLLKLILYIPSFLLTK